MVNEPVNASSPAGDIAAHRTSFLVLPMLDTFPETCWPAKVVGVRSPEKAEPSP